MQDFEKPLKAAPSRLVLSEINHTRHAPRPHFLSRPGLSLLIDLDQLDDAHGQSSFFSVNRFNLLSFYEHDYGCFHKAAHNDNLKNASNLADYVRLLANQYGLKQKLSRIDLLTFPRIFGVSFNPISVYHGYNAKDELCILVYEVHNTFGDIHSYVALIDNKQHNQLHACKKLMHVSPFFDLEGDYLLSVRQRDDRYSLLIRYDKDGKAALTATLRGYVKPLTTATLVKALISQRQWPLRPWFAIHFEAVKLFVKKLRFFSRPEPASKQHSLTSARGVK